MSGSDQLIIKNYKGTLLVLLSALFFGFMTVFIKMAKGLPAAEILFFRFLTGLILVSAMLIFTRKPLKPVKPLFVILRAVLNLFAALLLYKGIQSTAISNANMLHMTFPVFVHIFAPFLNKEKNNAQYYFFLALTIFGVYLILNPSLSGINKGELYALISGVIAGGAISALRETRKHESSFVVLFYQMCIGSVVCLLMLPVFVIPRGIVLFYLLLAALSGIFGQVCITIGYRYIDAAPGSILSTARIFIVFILGVVIFDDPVTVKIIAGSSLIFISLIGISGVWQKYVNKQAALKYFCKWKDRLFS